jgi:hypothetical protein
MYYYLVGALKRRLILELQDSFSQHPVYRKIVPNIQNKFSFKERPQLGIVVKGSSANKIQLSADNFIGIVQSHIMLAYVGQPVYPLEWVREDLIRVKERGLETLPGVYFMEILQAPEYEGDLGYYVLDPLLTVTDEAVLAFQTGVEREAQLQQIPVRKTLRLWENRKFLLREGIDYNIDYTTGAIELLGRFVPNAILTADYRYAADSIGPVPFKWNSADFETLPGVVMAFGKRSETGQKVAVVVYQDRVDTAQAYGGRFETSFDLDVISRDTDQVEEITDLVMMYMWADKKRAQLATEGIEVVDVSMGGEAEDIYDETADLNYYQASMSVQLQADWEIHVPIPLTFSRVTPRTQESDLDPSAPSGLRLVPDDLFFSTRAIIVGRNNDFERIS